jgi:Caspase domain/PEGA domain
MRGFNNIRLAVVAVFVLLVHASAPAQSTRNLEPGPSETPHLSENGRYYAIVIGIDNYPSPLITLLTAVKDARAVADILSKSYGFQVKLLLDQDATRVNILNAINQFRDTLNENDSLLIYYAGHGYSDHAADKAYWLPVDADSIYSSNRIIADELTTDVRVQNARHVLIISDSCYSGGLARDADSPIQSAGRMVFLNRMLKNRSRTLMASGGDEPVSDSGTDGHSVFAYAILRALEQSSQSVFTASDLFYGSVRQQVAGKSNQLPQYSIIRNSSHDEGDFVFIKKERPLTETRAADQTVVAPPSVDSFVVVKAPAGAEIQIDQQFSGYSTAYPSRIKVQPGQRTVEVFLAGYRPWKQVVLVELGKQADVIANLAPIPAVDSPSNARPTGAISDSDLIQIHQLLTQYESAVNSRDVKQLKAIWPEIPPKKVEQYRTIPKGARVSITITMATLLEGNDNAIVKCKQSYWLDGKTQEDNVTFYVGRLNSGWIINQIPSSN